MTAFISIQEAEQKADQEEQEVSIRGWVWRERGSNKLKFITLRDSTGVLQCVLTKDTVGEEKFAVADTVHIEASMTLTGTIKKDERAPTGYEMHVKDFEIIGECENFPITKDQSPEFLLDNRHLWIRSRKLQAVMKVKSTITESIHDFFRKKKYFEFYPPILQPSQCEGGSTLFEVKYYQDKTYLSQSWQLYAEAMIYSLEKIYCIAPAFRAEKSKTSRHLSEFWMAEMEGAWLTLHDVTENAKELVKYIIKQVLEKNGKEITFLKRDLETLKKAATAEYPTITYTKALELLKEKGMNVEWGKDLRTLEEDELMKHFDTPVVVTEYPKEVMAFYKPVKDKHAEKQVALCFDMLAPEGYGEIVGGSQRETSLEELKKHLEKQGEDPSNYEWYMDLRRYGSVPHAGYGMGVERVVAWICGLDNIKDAIGFPRTMLRKSP
jgi:asparaginyl-tRNA synthetase